MQIPTTRGMSLDAIGLHPSSMIAKSKIKGVASRSITMGHQTVAADRMRQRTRQWRENDKIHQNMMVGGVIQRHHQ
jgi:hypothetical protein